MPSTTRAPRCGYPMRNSRVSTLFNFYSLWYGYVHCKTGKHVRTQHYEMLSRRIKLHIRDVVTIRVEPQSDALAVPEVEEVDTSQRYLLRHRSHDCKQRT